MPGNERQVFPAARGNVHGITASSEISRGLYVKGFIEDQSENCLIDTGAVKTILFNKVYGRLSQSQRSPLRNENTDIFLADGRSSKTQGTGDTLSRLGSQEIMTSLAVADIEEDAILGTDLLSQVGATLDIILFKELSL